MTRDEYMAGLAQALDFLSEEARAAALSFYAEMLDDRMEDGMEEEAAVAAMDSPEAIAQRIRNDKNAEKPGFDPRDTFANVADQARIAMESALEATDQALKNAGVMAQAAISKAENALESASRAIQNEIKKEAEGEYEQHHFSCPAQDIHGIFLHAHNMSIRIGKSQDDQAHLTYYSCEKDPYTVSLQDGVLTLSHLGGGKDGGIRISLFNFRQLKRWWHKGTSAIELLLPRDALCDLTAETKNGSITAEGLHALCRVSLTTSNSRIALTDVRCKFLDLKTSNGRIVLRDVQGKTGVNGKTSNGGIEGEQLISGGEISLATSNGSIRVGCQAQGMVQLITANGSIHASIPESRGITLRTSNASIRGQLPGPLSRWQIDSSTSNGRNSLPRHQEGELPLSVHTSNGNIDLEIP